MYVMTSDPVPAMVRVEEVATHLTALAAVWSVQVHSGVPVENAGENDGVAAPDDSVAVPTSNALPVPAVTTGTWLEPSAFMLPV